MTAYEITNLAPGTYKVSAVNDADPFTILSETQTVTITEGEETVLDFENLR